MNQIKIIHEPNNKEQFLIVYKPHNLPTAPLSAVDENNLLAYCIKLYPEIKNVKGKKEIEYGLVHRIDTVTAGLVLIATNQEFYDFIQNEQKNNNFEKFYRAECDIKTPEDTFPEKSTKINFNEKYIISSYFRYYGQGNKEVRPVLENANSRILKKVGKLKLYTTEILLKEENNRILADCKLTNGFKHQVRCHLAWIGFPIKNDPIYNEKTSENINFVAYKLIFNNLNGKRFEFYI